MAIPDAAGRADVTVLGAGFAGSILARLLAVRGRRVLLVDRGRHPRFALGESSTPLAAIALERLARGGDGAQLADLAGLAAHGRWRHDLPGLRRGLKRGFTFYGHRRGLPFDPTRRLLVAASPDEEVADCQWMRSDVDAHLAQRAVDAGVELHEEVDVVAVEPVDDGYEIQGELAGDPWRSRTGFVVDATGGSEAVRRSFGNARVSPPAPFSSRVVYGHFRGVSPFPEVVPEMAPGPFPDEWAAVHHLLDEGWLYTLRFDDGTTSAGLVLDDERAIEGSVIGVGHRRGQVTRPAADWEAVLGGYPELHAAFARAEPIDTTRVPGDSGSWAEHGTPREAGFESRCADPAPASPIGVPSELRQSGRLQHRLSAAAGPGWAVLPQAFAFFDPMFSTGIAWSLLGVERLADVLTADSPAAGGGYDPTLRAEAGHLGHLFEAAYEAMPSLDLLRCVSYVYFAAASWCELRQRLLDPGPGRPTWPWHGFLGALEEAPARVFAELPRRVRAARRRRDPEGLEGWTKAAVAPFNVIGIGERRDHLYDVDLDRILASCDLLGLTRRELNALVPRLRGGVP